jgi:glycosyltransferase involved in cell wall biosynthesis
LSDLNVFFRRMRGQCEHMRHELTQTSTFRVSTAKSNGAGRRFRLLTITNPGHDYRPGSTLPEHDSLKQLELADRYPRSTFFEEYLGTDVSRYRIPADTPAALRWVYRFLPLMVPQAIDAILKRKHYDAIIAWGSRIGVLCGVLMRVTGTRGVLVLMTHYLSRPGRQFLLRFACKRFDAIITWSSVQRDYAIRELGFPASKVFLVSRRVDQKFFRPMEVSSDTICSAGHENRDYATLIDALRGLDIPCHIATEHVLVGGGVLSKRANIREVAELPPNVTVGTLGYEELRKLYARSGFVVVPLFPSDTDNGASTIQEAMAMGKAVICTRTQGQVDIIEEGVSGLFVEPGDVKGLREAILCLWNNPAVAKRMGEAGRRIIEDHHTLDHFVEQVKSAVSKTILDSELSTQEKPAHSVEPTPQ